jgi:hypothetical protein
VAKELRDIGASVRARLLNLARTRHQAMDLLLTRYAIERLLYRLSMSSHRDRFVLKGAMLVTTWFDDPHRPTRNVDLLRYGDAAPEAMLSMFREIAAVEANDGITFETSSMRIDPHPRERQIRRPSASDDRRIGRGTHPGGGRHRLRRRRRARNRGDRSTGASGFSPPAPAGVCA